MQPVQRQFGTILEMLTYLLTSFSRPTRHPSGLRDRFGLARGRTGEGRAERVHVHITTVSFPLTSPSLPPNLPPSWFVYHPPALHVHLYPTSVRVCRPPMPMAGWAQQRGSHSFLSGLYTTPALLAARWHAARPERKRRCRLCLLRALSAPSSSSRTRKRIT